MAPSGKRSNRKSTDGRRSQEDEAPVVVGVGGSAGSLEPLLKLLESLSHESNLAVVIVVHRDADIRSQLAEVAGRHTDLTVRDAVDGTRLERAHVYIIPPEVEPSVFQGHLSFMQRKTNGTHRPIDALLTSISRDLGNRSIGVLLSGAGSDGTAGIVAIKAEGGTTFCQDLKSATFKLMPQSAIATGSVDFILPPTSIARELTRISEHPYVTGTQRARAIGLHLEQGLLQTVFNVLRNRSGVDFSFYKQTTTMRRILRRMAVVKKESFDDYVHFLQQNPTEVGTLFDDLLIKVTSFFREPGAFDALERIVLPDILQAHAPGEAIRIWIPGCATGEQAYSVAICLAEQMLDARNLSPVQIFATDVSDAALRRARAGMYPAASISNLSPERLERYFSRIDGNYLINKFIREMCVFARQNVINDPPFSRLDLIVCSNLLIYLDGAAQKRLMPLFHYALRQHGYLVLGASESIGSFTHLFSLADKRHKVYSKKSAPVDIDFDFPPTSGGIVEEAAQEGVSTTAMPSPSNEFDLRREVDRLLLTRYAPAGVIINNNLEVVQFRGRTGQFLEPAVGPATHNVLKMAREGLLVDLRGAIQQARDANLTARRESVRVLTNDHHSLVNIEVAPLQSARLSERYFVVSFEMAAEAPVPIKKGKRGKKVDPELERVRQELDETRQDLQAIIEEKEASNEELKAANEEIQSSNEELQSTNEELQTAKEELQSANEELTTINEELQTRNLELNELNDDLSNLLSNVTIPVIMLGQDLRIRRFTPSAERIFNMIPTDVGRPITDINPNLELDNLPAVVSEVLDTLTPRELRVHDKRGNWFSVRVRPYRTSEKKIEGVVVVLFELDELKQTMDRERDTHTVLEAVLREMRRPVALIDEEGRIVGLSAGVRRLLQLPTDDWVGRHAASIPHVGDVLAALAVDGKSTAAEQRTKVELGDGQEKWIQIRVARAQTNVPRWLATLDVEDEDEGD